MYLFLLQDICFNIYLFSRDRERVRAGEEQRKGETRNPKQAPGSEQAVSPEPDVGLEPTNREIMT